MTVYFISGLGSDHRLFEKLSLDKFITIKYLDWIDPEPGESMADYSRRMAEQIDEENQFILIGVSLGGMVAIEMNKFLHPDKTIIISSVAAENEYPFLFRFIRFTRIYKIVPLFLLRKPSPLAFWFFSARKREERQLLYYFMQTVSDKLFRWSINIVMNWKNNWKPSNLYHIQGTADRIFPVKHTHPDIIINDGGHMMVYDKAEEISAVLNRIIKL